MNQSGLFPCRLLTILASALAFGGVRAADSPRPNILFVLGDDWGWPHASCLGTPVVQTPHFDRVAREGVLFRNAHTAASSCSPSRAAILTGQWPWRLEQGAILRGDVAAKFAVFPEILERSGYFIGQRGKGYSPKDRSAPPRNMTGRNFPTVGAFLSARPSGQPFCFWLGEWKPHRPYQPGIGVKNGFDPSKVLVPPTLPDHEIIRRDICDYYYEIKLMDQALGDALAELDKAGELEQTLVVVTGDNGWPFPRGKATCYLAGTHQPLAMRWGTRVKGGRTVDDFVSLADLAPTFLAAAGISPPADMTARSLLPILLSDRQGQIDPARHHTLTALERHAWGRTDGPLRFAGYPMRAIVTRDYHYIRNFKPDRWPVGDPPTQVPTFESLAGNTIAAPVDCDNGPSKAWLVTRRDDPEIRALYELAFGKRPTANSMICATIPMS